MLRLRTSLESQVSDAVFALVQLAQTTMRSELGKITLDKTFEERESLNLNIVESINEAAESWGITCLRYEIRKLRIQVHIPPQCSFSFERFSLTC